MGKLVLYLADGSTLDIRLERERITIGRRADNDVCLPYPAVSGEHAAVVTILSDSFLEDLGSTNGTLVNGKPIAKHFLRDHDQIDIGRQKIVYLANEAAKVDPTDRSLGRLDNQLFGERVLPAKSTSAFDAPGEGLPGNEAAARSPAPQAQPVERKVRPGGSEQRSDRARSPRSDSGGSMADIDRFVAAEVGTENDAKRSSSYGNRDDPPPPALVGAPPVQVHVIRVLTGPSAGREVALDKPETSVGRVGVQVAAVRHTDNGLRLVPVEGNAPPRVNGEPVGAEGQSLQPGDTLEIAGVQLEIAEATATG
jgi:FHA domain